MELENQREAIRQILLNDSVSLPQPQAKGQSMVMSDGTVMAMEPTVELKPGATAPIQVIAALTQNLDSLASEYITNHRGIFTNNSQLYLTEVHRAYLAASQSFIAAYPKNRGDAGRIYASQIVTESQNYHKALNAEVAEIKEGLTGISFRSTRPSKPPRSSVSSPGLS